MSTSGQTQVAQSQNWLPAGWVVEVKERPGGAMKDKYYIEPINGHKFRSKKEVFRYLESGKAGSRKERIPRTRMRVGDVVNGGTSVCKITQDRSLERNTGSSSLGWQVKFIERENGMTEKYFVDPVNGYKFYSEKEIIHYLQTREATKLKKRVDSVVAEEVATPNRTENSNVVQVPPAKSLGRPLDWLPPGWQVEFNERKNGPADKYYIDPVSGYKFRSRKDVSRYLENGVFPARAGKKRKANESPLPGQQVSLSSVTKPQKLACRSTMKAILPEIFSNTNNLENTAVTPELSTMGEEKPCETHASDQYMEGTFEYSKSEGNHMVDGEVNYVLPLSVFSPEQWAVENQGKSKPGRKKPQSKKVPVNRKPKPDTIKSRKGREPNLPCRSSTRLAEMKPKKVDTRVEVDDTVGSTGSLGIEEKVNEVGKTNDVEENILKLESKKTESVIAMLFGESSSSMDPCLEFAYKTLAGIIPVENLPVKEVSSMEMESVQVENHH